MEALNEAIVDAGMLLGHAARRGLTLPPENTAAIVSIRGDTQPSVEAQTRFWPAFSSVAKLVQPVTVDSLKAALPNNGAAARAVRKYRRWAYGALGLLAIAQVYTGIGEKTVADLDSIPLNLADTADHVSSLLRAQSKEGGIDEQQTSQLRSLQRTLQSQYSQLHSSYHRLEYWRLGWHPVLALRVFAPSVRTASAAPDAPSIQDQVSTPAATDQYDPDEIEAIKAAAHFAIAALNDYALPFLYGLLGACVFILRNLSSEVKALSFTSDENYQLRIPLGALSGVAIAWFLAAMQSSNALKGLSPLPLAFLTGYSVEVLFSALDRLVAAFSSDRAAAAGTS